MVASPAIAHALAAHKGWKWLRGALCLRWAPGFADHLKPEAVVGGTFTDTDAREFGSVPDLDDAATIGTVEEQVRAVVPNAILYPPENQGDPWVINLGLLDHLAEGATRGEAWANAFLEVCR